jgi:hypothetical protein
MPQPRKTRAVRTCIALSAAALALGLTACTAPTSVAAAGNGARAVALAPAARSTTAPAPVAAGTVGRRIYIGAMASGYDQAVAGAGVPMAVHAYAFFTSPVPTGVMISVSAANTPWRQVAAAGPGSALYGDIVRWAQTIKARGSSVMIAYNHEPEGHDRFTLGSAADFIAAYRHVESIFDQQGATNVVWTWQMTEWAFRVGPSGAQDAAKWYPGDQWVDDVGADAYNWYPCRAGDPYTELQQMGDPALAFARAHGKTASFPEFGSDATANRAQWLANVHKYLVQNQDVVTAAFYFNRPPPDSTSTCRWPLRTAAEFAELRAMVQDTAHFQI